MILNTLSYRFDNKRVHMQRDPCPYLKTHVHHNNHFVSEKKYPVSAQQKTQVNKRTLSATSQEKKLHPINLLPAILNRNFLEAMNRPLSPMQRQLQIKITYRRTLKVVKENYKKTVPGNDEVVKEKTNLSLLLLHKVNLIIINPQRELHPIQSPDP
jgi:sRNA-binding protein